MESLLLQSNPTPITSLSHSFSVDDFPPAALTSPALTASRAGLVSGGNSSSSNHGGVSLFSPLRDLQHIMHAHPPPLSLPSAALSQLHHQPMTASNAAAVATTTIPTASNPANNNHTTTKDQSKQPIGLGPYMALFDPSSASKLLLPVSAFGAVSHLSSLPMSLPAPVPSLPTEDVIAAVSDGSESSSPSSSSSPDDEFGGAPFTAATAGGGAAHQRFVHSTVSSPHSPPFSSAGAGGGAAHSSGGGGAFDSSSDVDSDTASINAHFSRYSPSAGAATSVKEEVVVAGTPPPPPIHHSLPLLPVPAPLQHQPLLLSSLPPALPAAAAVGQPMSHAAALALKQQQQRSNSTKAVASAAARTGGTVPATTLAFKPKNKPVSPSLPAASVVAVGVPPTPASVVTVSGAAGGGVSEPAGLIINGESADLRRKRLARKAELARKNRQDKKRKLSDLELEVSQLKLQLREAVAAAAGTTTTSCDVKSVTVAPIITPAIQSESAAASAVTLALSSAAVPTDDSGRPLKRNRSNTTAAGSDSDGDSVLSDSESPVASAAGSAGSGVSVSTAVEQVMDVWRHNHSVLTSAATNLQRASNVCGLSDLLVEWVLKPQTTTDTVVLGLTTGQLNTLNGLRSAIETIHRSSLTTPSSAGAASAVSSVSLTSVCSQLSELLARRQHILSVATHAIQNVLSSEQIAILIRMLSATTTTTAAGANTK